VSVGAQHAVPAFGKIGKINGWLERGR
jgi:hypothetical protein